MPIKKDPKTGKYKTGRPTKYKKEFCEDVVEFMSKGKGLIQFAASISVGKDSIYLWDKKHPEFSEALKIGRLKCEAYWADFIQDKMINDENINVPAFKYHGANMFGWRSEPPPTKEEIEVKKDSINVNIIQKKED